MSTVRLKPGHVQPVWAGHPWVYAQAIEKIEDAKRGDEVKVVDPRGNFLGRGFFSPGSAIPVRLLTRDEETPIDGAFFRARFERALASRAALGLGGPQTNGYRLVHAEGDLLPGLIVNRFGDVLSLQLLTAGMKAREAMILDALEAVLKPRAIVDRTPVATAKAECFEPRPEGNGVIRGEEMQELAFTERGIAWKIPLGLGHKTGFYFDQRELRARVEALSGSTGAPKRVLDAYAYVGSFGVGAARAGAEVVCVDESALAVEMAETNAKANGLADRMTFTCADARKTMQEANASFDLVIVDPPRLAPTRSAREAALVMYAKLAELGCRATKPGGTLVLCSCSGAVDLAALTRALATGAVRANVTPLVVERAFQGPDHPVPAAFGEGLYLKALVARIEPR